MCPSSRILTHDGIHRFQRTALPDLHLLDHGFGHRRNQTRRYFHPVNLFQMSLDLARAHPPRVHRQDLVVETREASLSLAYDPRLETAVAIPRRYQIQFAKVALQLLLTLALARVATVLAPRIMLLVPQVLG